MAHERLSARSAVVLRLRMTGFNAMASGVAIALAVAAGLVASAAFAQESGIIEEVMVTGSRIATSGLNTPTPVTAVTS